MEKTNITIHLEPDKITTLTAFARNESRDIHQLIDEAIESFIELKQWQIAEITQAIQEADAGDFATDAEMDALTAKWTQ